MQRFFLLSFILLSFSLVALFPQDEGLKDDFYSVRKTLVDSLFPVTDNENSELKKAFMESRRDLYIPENYLSIAYKNMPVPSKGGLILPSPEMIVIMLKEAEITPLDKVLLIGRNSLYINDIISRLTNQLYVIDSGISPRQDMNYQIKNDLSYYGWLEEGPFDVIILFGSVESVPQSLVSQLKNNGKLIFPLSYNTGNQILTSINRYSNSIELTSIGQSYIHSMY